MLTERALQLINAELDKELGPGEREELDAILESSADARAMRAELQKLGNLLDAAPPMEPPPGLTNRILDQLVGPAKRRSRFSLADLFTSFQPATAGFGFAAGLLVAVAVYEFSSVSGPKHDTASMVGTLIAARQETPAGRIDAISVDASGLAGEIVLRGDDELLMLDFDIDSTGKTEIQVALDEAGLEFGGIALTGSASGENGSYEVSGGTLRLVNQGRRAFTVFLTRPVKDSTGGREIRIGISSGGEYTYSGVLRG